MQNIRFLESCCDSVLGLQLRITLILCFHALVFLTVRLHTACIFIEASCMRGRTGTGWQRNATNVRAEADEEASHCRDASTGTRVERKVDDG